MHAPYLHTGPPSWLEAGADGGDCRCMVVGISRSSRSRTLLACLTARFRLAAASRLLRGAGYTAIRRFGVFPDLAAPTLVYDLDAPAARYAEKRLLPGGVPAVPAFVRRALAWWSAGDPRLACILLAGWKP